MAATIRLDDEPISVVMPPRIEMKLSGIRARPRFNPIASAMALIIGMKITTTGVLLRKALVMPATIKTSANARAGFRCPN